MSGAKEIVEGIVELFVGTAGSASAWSIAWLASGAEP